MNVRPLPFEKEVESLCEVEEPVLVYKFCGSENTIKRGFRSTQRGKIQRFFCKDCERKFIVNEGFEKMKSTPQTITIALDLYFKGISMRSIVDLLKRFLVDGLSLDPRFSKYLNL